MTTTRTPARTDTLLGSVVAVAFVVLLASSNSITPLLPLFRARHDLDELTSALLFAAYQIVLAPTLWICARESVQRRAGVLLPAGLALVVCGNLMMTAETVPWLFAGRIVTGLAVGIATGATATLAFAGLGQGGRTVAATGNLVGAVAGTALAAGAAQWVTSPAEVTAWTLSALATAVLAVVTVLLVRARWTSRVETGPQPNRTEEGSTPASRAYRIAGFTLGSVAWIFIMTALVVIPARLTHSEPEHGALLSGAAALTLLLAAAISQFLVFRHPRVLSAFAAGGYLAAGALLLALGSMVQSIPITMCGMLVGGVGNGVGYRVGLSMATTGLDATAHGAQSSRYVFVAYAAGVIGLVALTLLGTVTGDVWVWLTVMVAATGCAAWVRRQIALG